MTPAAWLALAVAALVAVSAAMLRHARRIDPLGRVRPNREWWLRDDER